ncbi:hypothetical protein [Flagellimonas sp. CMM7]|uniref:hypothetical protein n=1 Tax=Flagellimonas sp. CMM7 TaxID=2654676 RepID=UPI0013CFF4C1|nr:hypothetical protein [Flagellimonas sp. CMM7]UII79565.1 hypothetical protein LV704_18130 [Flagellimonas sp. CMM7]
MLTPTKGGGLVKGIGAVSTAAGILGSIVPKEIVNNTVGAALKHGWKCWGASVNPDKASANIALWVPQLKDAAEFAIRANDSALESRINAFHKRYYEVGVKHRWWIERGGARDCTKEAIQLEMDALSLVKTEAVRAFQEELNERGHTMVPSTPITHAIPANGAIDLPATTWTVEQYRVVLGKKNVVSNVVDVVTGGSSGSGILPLVLSAVGFVMFRKKIF